MTSFNNTILNNIYKKFLKNEKSKNKGKMEKFKKNILLNELYSEKFFTYSTVALTICLCSIFLFGLVTNTTFNTSNVIFFLAALFSFLFNFVFEELLFEYRKHIKNSNKDDNMLNKPLSKEDFKTIMSNFNNKIVEKVMKENNNELCYQDLKKLDDLLLNQEESLIKIELEEIEEVLGKIDRENILKKFKGKSKEEIMEELKSIGFFIKDEENIIAERDFYRALKEKNKEECVL